MISACPICYVSVPSADLERHANEHLLDDEHERDMKLAMEIALADTNPRNAPSMELELQPNDYLREVELQRDMELAMQIALAPPSPRPVDETTNPVESSDAYCGRTKGMCSSSQNQFERNVYSTLDGKVSRLVDLQIKGSFYGVEGGLMNLLRSCLEKERGNLRSIITCHIDHYQSNEFEDVGWGCGWRNIQMLSSHLLSQRQDARNAMFGGSGFVPDIPSIQRWLEIAWEKGFDTFGAESFNNKIYGSKRWIGTTECAALFRSFGLRARIVDFDGESSSMKDKSRNKKRKDTCGPMDKFLIRTNSDSLPKNHDLDTIHKDRTVNQEAYSKYLGKTSGPQALMDWVWNYYSNELRESFDHSKYVHISEKTPLYFQHNGHSRTIVGIQMQKKMHEAENSFSLLVLDPGHRTTALEKSLRENCGWQKLIKRRVHTLRKPQYQLCYVDPGIAIGDEMEQLKVIDSILVEL